LGYPAKRQNFAVQTRLGASLLFPFLALVLVLLVLLVLVLVLHQLHSWSTKATQTPVAQTREQGRLHRRKTRPLLAPPPQLFLPPSAGALWVVGPAAGALWVPC
jgi:hypothetical protein